MKKKICVLILAVMTTATIFPHSKHTDFEGKIIFEFDDGEDPPVEDPPPPVPIDNWIPILMLFGIVFVGYKVMATKPENYFHPKKIQPSKTKGT